MSSQALTPELIRGAQSACERFEADLSAFVDGELTSFDAATVSTHVEECEGCRAFVHALAGMGEGQRDQEAEQVVDRIGAGDLWTDLTRRLLADTETRLGDVLYELGKALILSGLKTGEDVRGLRFHIRKPKSIPGLSRKGRQLVKEHQKLRAKAGQRRGRNLQRDLFPGTRKVAGSEAFEAGRLCLEQCLRVAPDCHEARIYLSHYHRMTGRFDRARQMARTVLRSPAPSRLRLIALQQLSRIHSAAYQFQRALEGERDVLSWAEEAGDDFVQALALTNIIIYAVKADHPEEAETALARLVRDYPSRLDEVVAPTLARARDFRRQLLRHPSLLGRLRQRYPEVFPT